MHPHKWGNNIIGLINSLINQLLPVGIISKPDNISKIVSLKQQQKMSYQTD